ncbi:MAG: heparan-alpha-glucosaminide N-acetyltransferase domain-containing protein [Bacteroidota bacterium]
MKRPAHTAGPASPEKVTSQGGPPAGRRPRITAIDVMRGLVIVLMMVDHVRERFFYHISIGDPINLEVASASLFFTRLSSHLCAPVFVFLAGLGAWLYAHPKSGVARSPSHFLFTRGLFLVVPEVVLINQSWFWGFPPEAVYLQVIWVIGLSMMALSVVVRLPHWAIAVIGLTIVFGHNLLDPINVDPGELGYTLWTILHDRGVLFSSEALTVWISYPALPWIGVIVCGYALGPVYGANVRPEDRTKRLLQLGAGCLMTLVVLRGFNLYGEALPWTVGATPLETLMSMLNYTKYPPSLAFLLLTLGLALLLLAWLDTKNNPVTRVLQTFGKAPMFVYALHLYVLLVCYTLVLVTIGPNAGDLYHIDHVWQIWALTALLAAALYLPTRAFGRYKRRTDKTWVRYF